MAAVSLSVSTVKPLADRVFVKMSPSEEKTAGGLYLPDTAKEKPQVGEVVALGPGKRNDDGARQEGTRPDCLLERREWHSRHR